MINKIKDIPNGAEVWVKMERHKGGYDSDKSIRFIAGSRSGEFMYLDDSNTIFTEEEMREKFSDDAILPKLESKECESIAIPHLGEKILVRCKEAYDWNNERKFICFHKRIVIVEDDNGYISGWDFWRFPPKKIQKTLAELEKELGYEEGTLEITN